MNHPTVTGARRLPTDQRVTHLTSPLPKIEGALLAAAQDLDAEHPNNPVVEHITAALRTVAEELHCWL